VLTALLLRRCRDQQFSLLVEYLKTEHKTLETFERLGVTLLNERTLVDAGKQSFVSERFRLHILVMRSRALRLDCKLEDSLSLAIEAVRLASHDQSGSLAVFLPLAQDNLASCYFALDKLYDGLDILSTTFARIPATRTVSHAIKAINVARIDSGERQRLLCDWQARQRQALDLLPSPEGRQQEYAAVPGWPVLSAKCLLAL